MLQFINIFQELEASSGLMLLAAAALAMIIANSPLAGAYAVFFHSPAAIMSINDGLMAVFFLMVGLEIKREMISGELSTRAKAIFPVVTALGGVIFPAVIYLWFNAGSENARGWAIASATDIAFSLGILSLFGSRVAPSLKIFLLALAVIDDLIAVLIIATFYTDAIHGGALLAAFACAGILYVMNRRGVTRIAPYMAMGLLLWFAVLYSGVHATVAGVVLGALIPASLGEKIIEAMHSWVAFCIMPLFAFANAGISMQNLQGSHVMNPLSLGIIGGLFFGKQFGIAICAKLLVATRLARLPEGTGWLEFYAVALFAGIGFTMSLFIGGLAFAGAQTLMDMKFGVIGGSLLSAMGGCALMAIALKRKSTSPGE
jgi:Na+:H+ antiporter, NhaA family